jgi:hypothetical protein
MMQEATSATEAIQKRVTIGHGLTTGQLLEVIGTYLREERLRRKWNLIDVQQRGGPNYLTVEYHEQGRIRTFAKLRMHLKVFDIELCDLLSEIFQPLSTRVNRISAESVEARHLIERYSHTTAEGREVLRRMAALLPYVEDETIVR